MFIIPEKATPVTKQQCVHPDCTEEVTLDFSHRLGVGMSHFRKRKDGSYEQSYSQVFNTQHACSREHALEVTHTRIDTHATLPFGTITTDHNPDGTQDTATLLANVPYHTATHQLPQTDAITGESLQGATDIYVPHVDDSSRGATYQSILAKSHPGYSAYDLTLGTATLEDAIKLAHLIVDEIITPDYEQATKG